MKFFGIVLLMVSLIGCSSNVNTSTSATKPVLQSKVKISLDNYYSDKIHFSIKHDKFIEEQSKCFVKVTVPETNSHGTGIVVYKTEKETWIITCFHVIDDSLFNIAIIETPGDSTIFFENGVGFVGVIKCVDPRVDLALIKVPANIKDVSVCRLTNGSFPSVGTDVFCFGFPMTHDLTLSSGIIRKYTYVNHFVHIETTCAIWKGMSGGGLFDKNGYFIGVLQRMYSSSYGPQNTFSDFISSYEILKFLEFNGFKDIVDFHINQ